MLIAKLAVFLLPNWKFRADERQIRRFSQIIFRHLIKGIRCKLFQK